MLWLFMISRRHFFDWTLPLASQAARWLLDQAGPGPCPDLSSWAVIVPTAEAGRRLRSALLRECPSGILPPATFTPVRFLDICAFPPLAPVATSEERLLAWCTLLLECDFQEFSGIFPDPPEHRDFAWTKGAARLFLQAQMLLIENGWTFQSVAQQASVSNDLERWRGLARLEQIHARLLAQAGRADPAFLWVEALRNPRLPGEYRQLALLGTPDPVPALIRFLENLPDGPCHVGIHAPASQADAFDPWGRPEIKHWTQRELWDAGMEPFLHLTLSEENQSRFAASLASAHGDTRAIVLGIGREELAALLEADLREAGLQPFDPSGNPASRFALWPLLESLQRLLANGRFTDLLAWARHPGAQHWIRRRYPGLDFGELFLLLDRFAQRHLPQAWTDIRDIPMRLESDRILFEALARAAEMLLQKLSGKNWIPALREFLQEAAETATSEDAHCAERVRAWLETQESFQLPGPHPGPADRLALFLEEMAAARIPGDRPSPSQGIVEFSGWLELGWDERPHLVLTGFQEGGIPRSIVSDFFVPESLRPRLGLRTSEGRLACDAYQLKEVTEQRRSGGRVDLLLSKFSAEGDPLLPSRLLFLCPDPDLAARVRHVFETPGPDKHPAPPSLAFKLKPIHRAPAKKTISVTHFRDFLESPFYYYLHRLCLWEPVEGSKQEMDPLDFGTLAHTVLESLGRDPALHASSDASALRSFLRARLEAEASRIFGPARSLAPDIQLQALHNRFSAFAEKQAAETAEGWVIQEVECPFELPFQGWTIKGKIDRIDRHPDGRVRLLDYKTSDQAEPPEKAHLRRCRGTPEPGTYPEEALALIGGKPALWRNLQLPLYYHYWNLNYPEDRGRVQCGYIQLPQAVQETSFALWNSFDGPTEASALECAAKVLDSIDSGRFWPPFDVRIWKQDPWSFWLPGGPSAVVEGAGL